MADGEKPETDDPKVQHFKQQMPERRCVLTKAAEPIEKMVRLAHAPDGTLVPDVAGRLPGRGVWVLADGSEIGKAIANSSLHKAAARSLKARLPKGAVPENLVELIDGLLVRRCLDRLGLEQRAGNLVSGFEKIKAALGKRKGDVPLLIVAATDGAEDGQKKIQWSVGRDVPVAKLFDREALSKALGRENVVHVLLFKSGGTEKLKADVSRLLSLRGNAPLTCDEQGIEE